MKKIILVLVTLAVAFSFTACGVSSDKAEGETLKVGFIYNSSAQDGGFSQAQDEGRLAMEKKFGGKVETEYLEEVPGTAQDAREAAITLMDKGCTVIVGTSYGYMDTLEALSKEYPDNYFLHFSGSKSNDTNFDNYFGAMEEPQYLAGMAAGEMTKSDKIGCVAPYPYTEVQIGINAFALGAQSVNKNVEIKVVYINNWYDPTNEKAAAEALLAQGCDIIAQDCDSTGPIEAAKSKGAYAIGYSLDKSKAYKDTLITTPIWHHEVYYNKAIQAIIDGNFKPESYYGTLKDGYLGLANFGKFVPEKVQKSVKSVQEKMISGQLAPFQGEIKYANGKTLCKKGQTLTREEIWKIDNVVEGVTSTEKK
ncbi:MAG: BMP family ABC transporter substrate-binding protein [Anaerovoracaceae bacterium]